MSTPAHQALKESMDAAQAASKSGNGILKATNISLPNWEPTRSLDTLIQKALRSLDIKGHLKLPRTTDKLTLKDHLNYCHAHPEIYPEQDRAALISLGNGHVPLAPSPGFRVVNPVVIDNDVDMPMAKLETPRKDQKRKPTISTADLEKSSSTSESLKDLKFGSNHLVKYDPKKPSKTVRQKFRESIFSKSRKF